MSRSRRLLSHWARALIPSSSQAGWFARTRATGAATSAGPSIGTFATTESSAGLITSKVSRASCFVDAAALFVPAVRDSVSIAMLAPLVAGWCRRDSSAIGCPASPSGACADPHARPLGASGERDFRQGANDRTGGPAYGALG